MTLNTKPLVNELALVTGSSRGIGRAIALDLAERGATVIGTATTEQGAAGISEYLREADFSGVGEVMDVTDQESVAETVAAVNEKYGAVSILINNAGITLDGLLMAMKEPQWQDVIETNLSGMYRVTKACLRGMSKARKGRVINISSVVGAIGNAGQSNYAAAKAGMIGFTKSLAREVASRNITVNAVAPGFIETDMTRHLDENQRQAMLENIPLARFGSVEEVAGLVGYLVSPQAAYITGQTIHLNGGMYMA